MENFVPINKPPTIKVRTWQKQRQKQNMKSMLRVYCNQRLGSASPHESNAVLRPNCNTRMSTISTAKVINEQDRLSSEPPLNNTHLFQYDLVTQRVKEQKVSFVGIVMHVKQFVSITLPSKYCSS